MCITSNSTCTLCSLHGCSNLITSGFSKSIFKLQPNKLADDAVMLRHSLDWTCRLADDAVMLRHLLDWTCRLADDGGLKHAMLDGLRMGVHLSRHLAWTWQDDHGRWKYSGLSVDVYSLSLLWRYLSGTYR
ncbi:hypothetical protein pipiens_017596 [Culex pipiens pipiens]|uniref:Uncharacterized protein n=1 Tax=Culex pipiens pipiens TaxID=38569 RepID=A0ABD1CGJ7_CULPP